MMLHRIAWRRLEMEMLWHLQLAWAEAREREENARTALTKKHWRRDEAFLGPAGRGKS